MAEELDKQESKQPEREAASIPPSNPWFTPNDDQSVFGFTLAARRRGARNVEPGSRPSLPGASRTSTSVAMDAVRSENAEVEFADSAVPAGPPAGVVASPHAITWTELQNQRRCELVDKEIAGEISAAEQTELERLQSEMLAYRRSVAPLPLDDLRELHEQLLSEFADPAD